MAAAAVGVVDDDAGVVTVDAADGSEDSGGVDGADGSDGSDGSEDSGDADDDDDDDVTGVEDDVDVDVAVARRLTRKSAVDTAACSLAVAADASRLKRPIGIEPSASRRGSSRAGTVGVHDLRHALARRQRLVDLPLTRSCVRLPSSF